MSTVVEDSLSSSGGLGGAAPRERSERTLLDIIDGAGRFADARYDPLRRRLRVARGLFIDGVDELDLGTLARALRLHEGVSDKIARQDVLLVAEALGWAEERRPREGGGSETWLISARVAADEEAADAADEAVRERSVTWAIRLFLQAAYQRHGKDFRVGHARLGHHVAAKTGAGNVELERFLNRGARNGEWKGNALEGWTYNPAYQHRTRKTRSGAA